MSGWIGSFSPGMIPVERVEVARPSFKNPGVFS
jgi:hypothetical protein